MPTIFNGLVLVEPPGAKPGETRMELTEIDFWGKMRQSDFAIAGEEFDVYKPMPTGFGPIARQWKPMVDSAGTKVYFEADSFENIKKNGINLWKQGR